MPLPKKIATFLSAAKQAQKRYPTDEWESLRKPSTREGFYFQVLRMLFDYRIIETDGIGVCNNWCFLTLGEAMASFELFKPDTHKEPTGWYRHYESHRRRDNGDPRQEYIQP